MAAKQRTASTPRRATAAKAANADGRKHAKRPHFGVMDTLNQALFDLKATVQAIQHISTHGRDTTENEESRDALWHVLTADLDLLVAAEREAWRVVVKGGAA